MYRMYINSHCLLTQQTLLYVVQSLKAFPYKFRIHLVDQSTLIAAQLLVRETLAP